MRIIDNQPISFRPVLETDSDCNTVGKKTYCQLYQWADDLYAQWKADPCSEELITCDFDTEGELVKNGNFTDDASDWILDAGWSWSSGKVCDDGTPNQAITQTLVGLVVGKTYRISFLLSNYVSDFIILSFTGDAYPTNFNAAGFYSVLMTATSASADLIFIGANNFEGCLTQISVTELPDCWTTEDEKWTFADGYACHTDGLTGALINTDVVLITGTYYKVTITVLGLTSGSINLYLGGSTETLDSNGTFTRFITAGSTDTVFKIIPTSDFDGCVSSPSLFKYPAIDDYKVNLFDLDDVLFDDIGDGNLTYDDDFVTLKWVVPEIDGCFKICVTEICKEPLGWDNWTLEATSDAELTIDNKLIFTGGGSGTSTATHSVGALQACTYTVQVRFGDIDPSHEGNDIRIDFGDAFVVYPIDGTTANSTQSFEFIPSPAINEDIIFSFDNDATGDLEILYILISSSCEGQQDPDYCSNCISIKEEHPCTMKFIATSCGADLGFKFGSVVYSVLVGFALFARLRVLFMNPTSKNRNENYKFSDNSYYKSYADRDKIWDLLFDYTDEISHDYINTMLICDQLLIVNPLIPVPSTLQGQLEQYDFVWTDDDYKPEWDRDGRQSLAQSRIQVRKKYLNISNSNCCS